MKTDEIEVGHFGGLGDQGVSFWKMKRLREVTFEGEEIEGDHFGG